MGLENIHTVAKDGGYILNIELSDWEDDIASVQLPFQLGGMETNYSLQVQQSDTFSTLESSLGADAVLGLPFTTRDWDNDHKVNINCAKHLSGKEQGSEDTSTELQQLNHLYCVFSKGVGGSVTVVAPT